MSFTFSSSSSESDEDDDQPQSYARNNQFHWEFRNARYEIAYEENWPNQYNHVDHINQPEHVEHLNQSVSSHVNGFGNTSVLDSSAIINEPADNFVLIPEPNGFYRKVRVINPNHIQAQQPSHEAPPDHQHTMVCTHIDRSIHLNNARAPVIYCRVVSPSCVLSNKHKFTSFVISFRLHEI